MPPRAARDVPTNALVREYEAALRRLTAMENQLLDPVNWRKLGRVRAIRARVLREVSRLDRTARAWVRDRLPDIYVAGAETMLLANPDVAFRFQWSQFHREAFRAISSDTLDYLLTGNQHVATRTRDLVRRITHDETVRKVLDGDTPRQEAKRILHELRDVHGITKIPDRSGRLMRVESYSEMVARTQSALAYNRGAITQAVEDRVEWVEVFDGSGCGWSSHTDPDGANGSVRRVEDAAAYPIAHPRCLRAFAPRPDLGLARSRADLADRVEAGAARGATPALVGAGRRGQSVRRLTPGGSPR